MNPTEVLHKYTEREGALFQECLGEKEAIQVRRKRIQPGTELCQAQVKLGYLARSLNLSYKVFMSLMIVT